MQKDMIDSSQWGLWQALLIFLGSTVAATAINGKTDVLFKTLKADLSQPQFVLSLLIMLGVSAWGLSPQRSTRIRQVTATAVSAGLIAWLSHAGLVFAAFYVTLFITLFYVFSP